MRLRFFNFKLITLTTTPRVLYCIYLYQILTMQNDGLNTCHSLFEQTVWVAQGNLL